MEEGREGRERDIRKTDREINRVHTDRVTERQGSRQKDRQAKTETGKEKDELAILLPHRQKLAVIIT